MELTRDMELTSDMQMTGLPWEREGVTCSDSLLLETGRAVILDEAAELTRAAGKMDESTMRTWPPATLIGFCSVRR